MIEIKQLHHNSIVVQDVDASRRFYCDILGMEEVPRPPSWQWLGAWFRKGDCEVHVIHESVAVQERGDAPNTPTRPEYGVTFARHFAFRVADMEAAVATLDAHRWPIIAGPRERGDGATQLYVYDPDGHMVELAFIPWMD